MKTRFRKVWCGECRTMQFAGECPHQLRVGRVETPPAAVVSEIRLKREGPPSIVSRMISFLSTVLASPIAPQVLDNAFALAAGDDKPKKKRRRKKAT